MLRDPDIAAWLPGLPAERSRLLADVLSCYSDSRRHYHDTVHVRAVVNRVVMLLGELGSAISDPPTVVWAALWHDAIYDPRSSTNELDSASLARSALGALGVDQSRLDELERLIMLTAGHRVAHDDLAGAVLVDSDLAVLGADPGTYAVYVAGIRHEYQFVAEGAWRRGRAVVLQNLLDLPKIFSTEAMRAYESVARRNLANELATL